MPEQPSWDDVFDPTPGSWGLRGDRYAWFLLRARLGGEDLPEQPRDVRARAVGALREVVGLDLDDPRLPESLYVHGWAFGGMSSGSVSLHHWRDRLLPLLVERAAALQGRARRSRPTPTWQGVVAAAPDPTSRAHLLADHAKAGDWPKVLDLLRSGSPGPNAWRPSGTSLFTPLHQAAWHGAPVDVVQELLDLGAWRRLRDAKGRRAVDVAREHGSHHIVPLLEPLPVDVDEDDLGLLDVHLAALVESRIRPQLDVQLRHPQCAVLTELPDRTLWYPVPGMHGGFRVVLRESHLYVESWVRVVGGSGRAHVVTREGSALVRSGFV